MTPRHERTDELVRSAADLRRIDYDQNSFNSFRLNGQDLPQQMGGFHAGQRQSKDCDQYDEDVIGNLPYRVSGLHSALENYLLILGLVTLERENI